MAVTESPVQVTPRKEPRQARARMLVDSVLIATEQLSHAGVDAWTTNHVADRAGVSIGSIYQYFPSKESLVSALYTRLRTTRLEAFAAAVARQDEVGVHVARALLADPEGHALERALRRYLVEAAADRRLRQVDAMLGTIVAAELQRRGWDVAAARRLAKPIATAIEAIVAQCCVADEPSHPDELAVVFEALLLR